MSDLSINNDAWLSKLRNHLDAESYTAGTVSQYMGVARRFVADLNKQRVAITAARLEDIDRHLQQAPWTHPLRHEDSPDYRHWRSTPLNMLFARSPRPMAARRGYDHARHEVATGDLWMTALRDWLGQRYCAAATRSAVSCAGWESVQPAKSFPV